MSWLSNYTGILQMLILGLASGVLALLGRYANKTGLQGLIKPATNNPFATSARQVGYWLLMVGGLLMLAAGAIGVVFSIAYIGIAICELLPK